MSKILKKASRSDNLTDLLISSIQVKLLKIPIVESQTNFDCKITVKIGSDHVQPNK